MNLNAKMESLAQKYGTPTIDYFGGGTWRIWFQTFHQHRRHSWGISSGGGGFASQGNSLEQAIERIEKSAAELAPNPGFHCTVRCPHYRDDCY